MDNLNVAMPIISIVIGLSIPSISGGVKGWSIVLGPNSRCILNPTWIFTEANWTLRSDCGASSGSRCSWTLARCTCRSSSASPQHFLLCFIRGFFFLLGSFLVALCTLSIFVWAGLSSCWFDFFSLWRSSPQAEPLQDTWRGCLVTRGNASVFLLQIITIYLGVWNLQLWYILYMWIVCFRMGCFGCSWMEVLHGVLLQATLQCWKRMWICWR